MTWLSWLISNVVLAGCLALLAAAVQRWLGALAIARLLWLLALLKLLTPPVVSVPLSESPGLLACVLGTCACGTHVNSTSPLVTSLPWILLAMWIVGAGVTGYNAWRRWSHFQRLLVSASPAPVSWQTLALKLATDLSLWRMPKILVVPGRLPPFVISGWRGPRMVLPRALVEQLEPTQVPSLLLHELVHLKNRDHLVRLFELVVRVVFWWLPMVGAIGRQLRVCEEARCDGAVVAHMPHARRGYAKLLLDVLEFVHPLPTFAIPQATGMSVATDVEQRLRAILETRSPGRVNRLAALLTLVFACAVLPCELRYGLARGAQPAARSNTIFTTCEPGAPVNEPTNQPVVPAEVLSMCCPS
ncbi:MAG TPA: M56 family metallopeptidase [Pirellulales bacterium]|nr:M56 family metallopeptidase [Pirellulales bacterium]